MLRRFLLWLFRLLFGSKAEPKTPPPTPGPDSPPEPGSPAPTRARTIVPLLIFPHLTGDEVFNQVVEVAGGKYYTSTPWDIDRSKVDSALLTAEDWLSEALGRRIKWEQVRVIDSHRSLAEWRTGQIGLIRGEVESAGLEWTDEHVYLAFVRGMGGYAGGIHYQNGEAGYAMVGDICLEAICEYPLPTAGSVLLGDQGWPANSYSRTGQTGAFIHEALHGLDLPHPDGWPENNRPGWDETLMGHWWNMPNFANTSGLTQQEVAKVLRWTA